MDDVENEKFSWKTQLWLWCQLREVVLIPDSYSLTYFHTGNSPYFHFPVILQLWNSGGLSLLFFFFFSHPFLHKLLSFSPGIFALSVDSLKFSLEMENAIEACVWQENWKEFSLAAFSILGMSVEEPGSDLIRGESGVNQV